MKKISLPFLALALASASALAAPQAHPSATPMDHCKMAAMPEMSSDINKAFDALDTNKDGQLSKAELAKHPMAAHASMVDADKNGSLSRDEFKALQQV
jgi:hypothetical protein